MVMTDQERLDEIRERLDKACVVPEDDGVFLLRLFDEAHTRIAVLEGALRIIEDVNSVFALDPGRPWQKSYTDYELRSIARKALSGSKLVK